MSPETEADLHAFEDLTRVNNEMVNLHRELSKRNAQLTEINEQKNRLLGMAVHDLRNPLGNIYSYACFLEDDMAAVLNADQLEFIETIKQQSKFMLDLVTDLLDVAAIEAGQLRLRREPMQLDVMAAHSVAMHRRIAGKKDITISYEPGENVPAIVADGGKLEQVLNNLLENAVKYSPRGTAIDVSVVGGHDAVTVSVTDRGEGLSAADLKKLFLPFGTTSVRATEGEQSTGLGLCIARRIVEGHGGRISVASEVGVGSVFTVSIPTA
jgi:signal transduction histidine kinase